jgi:hypothetical protein
LRLRSACGFLSSTSPSVLPCTIRLMPLDLRHQHKQPVLSKFIVRTRARVGSTERRSLGDLPLSLWFPAVAKGNHGLDNSLIHCQRRAHGAIGGPLGDYRDLRIAGLSPHLRHPRNMPPTNPVIGGGPISIWQAPAVMGSRRTPAIAMRPIPPAVMTTARTSFYGVTFSSVENSAIALAIVRRRIRASRSLRCNRMATNAPLSCALALTTGAAPARPNLCRGSQSRRAGHFLWRHHPAACGSGADEPLVARLALARCGILGSWIAASAVLVLSLQFSK